VEKPTLSLMKSFLEKKAMIKTGRGSLLKRLEPKAIRLLPVLLLASLWVFTSCNITAYEDGGGEKGGGIYQTRILKVYADPDTVARGDTTRITCVIEDSLNKSFIFVWFFKFGKTVNTRDTTWEQPAKYIWQSSGHRNYIDWVAPTDTSSGFGIDVRVDNHSDSIAVESGTGVWVK